MRVKRGLAGHRRHKKYLDAAKGFRGGRSRLYRTAREAVERSLQNAFTGRKLRKRDFRSLWILRINAGARLSGAASLTATGGSLTCGTADALFTLTDGEASVSLTGVALTRSGGGALLSVLSGRLSLLCDYQALEGELSVADGATLSVTLQNNSTFTGSVSADERMRLSLSLDATSRWFVTGDSYVETLSDADATLQNIESNGFTIYYNSENEANAWLGSKPYALPGGG